MWPSTTAAYGSVSKLRNGAAFWAMATIVRTNMIFDWGVIRSEIRRLKCRAGRRRPPS